MEEVSPSSPVQVKVKEGVPPVRLMVADPSLPSKQVTFVLSVRSTQIESGCPMVRRSGKGWVQPMESVMVTE